MSVYHWILLGGFTICFLSCLGQFIKVMQSSKLKPHSKPLGRRVPGIGYSLTGAMSPAKKETAYLHLPTYTAGILFHLGTFCSILIIVLHFFNITFGFSGIIAAFLFITSGNGLFILVKRMVMRKMRSLSNPDDYISNLLVTLFHGVTALALIGVVPQPLFFLYGTVLFLYIPVGKLRHTVYFFTSRFHLGLFYGWRGVWPVKKGGV